MNYFLDKYIIIQILVIDYDQHESHSDLCSGTREQWAVANCAIADRRAGDYSEYGSRSSQSSAISAQLLVRPSSSQPSLYQAYHHYLLEGKQAPPAHTTMVRASARLAGAHRASIPTEFRLADLTPAKTTPTRAAAACAPIRAHRRQARGNFRRGGDRRPAHTHTHLLPARGHVRAL
jgi:hypothetical protein